MTTNRDKIQRNKEELERQFLMLDAKKDGERRIAEITARYALVIMQDAIAKNGYGMVNFPMAELAKVWAQLNVSDSIDRKSMTGGVW